MYYRRQIRPRLQGSLTDVFTGASLVTPSVEGATLQMLSMGLHGDRRDSLCKYFKLKEQTSVLQFTGTLL